MQHLRIVPDEGVLKSSVDELSDLDLLPATDVARDQWSRSRDPLEQRLWIPPHQRGSQWIG